MEGSANLQDLRGDDGVAGFACSLLGFQKDVSVRRKRAAVNACMLRDAMLRRPPTEPLP